MTASVDAHALAASLQRLRDRGPGAALESSLQQVADARLRPQLAAIVACEAEHLAVVSELRGERIAPDAFVTGKQR